MNKALRKFKNQEGYTLIEVLMAMIIFTIGLLGLAPMMVTSMTGNSFANDLTTANIIASDYIENLKTVGTFSPMPFIETTNNVEGKFTRQTRIDNNSTDGSVPSGLYRIAVTVNWTDQQGLARSVSYNTFRTEEL
ncbi:MAG: prepilin-type N-terminal cleavage/methylation domain-containing protein [candidate division Zixibacteria bacterium]|nr:prepilin-type N-terminal cleavage/methylation domain-containing protein [candidate division Zixibacteria bacterium]